MQMGDQFELNLLEQLDTIPGHKPFPRRVGRGLTVIDVEPEQGPTGQQPRALKAQASFLPANSLSGDAFRLTLLQCKWHITANMPAVAARDVEGMHQLRVGLRRLRVALSSFGGDFRNTRTESLRLHAKSLANRMAPARDFDVFCEELFEPPATANGALDAFDVLRKRAQVARSAAWDEAVTLVTGPKLRVLLNDINEAIDHPAWSGSLPGQAGATKRMLAAETPCTKLADSMLAHRLKSARKKARHLERLSNEQRHTLRISLKKLRYTAEFFAPFYERPKVAKFLGRLSKMQDVLGALNDVAVAHKTLDILIAAEQPVSSAPRAEVSFAAGIVYGWHLERAAHMWEEALSRWKKFSRTDAFWGETGA